MNVSNQALMMKHTQRSSKSYLLHRDIKKTPLKLIKNKGHWLWAADDNGDVWKIFDASGGAAVSCIGHGQETVVKAMHDALDTQIVYAPFADFSSKFAEDLAEVLIESTNHAMGRVAFYGSGTEGVEAATKFCLQYHAEMKPNPEPSRTIFIARHNSYHGITLNTLDLGGHEARKNMFRSNLPRNTHHVSPCYPYRNLDKDETEDQYVARLAQELEETIQRLGSQNVAGFFLEPVVGAALGCVAPPRGYLQAVKDVCVRHGVHLIFDEVMCGMGRTGYLHAWQMENVVPDIQIVGKGLAGGYAQISALLISKPLTDILESNDKSAFNHGHTFQNNPQACAAALAVMKYIGDNNLISNISQRGIMLRHRLVRALASHRYVGDIRGTAGFIGIEFVMNKKTKESFPSANAIAWRLHEKGMSKEYGIYMYPGSGSSVNGKGDYLIIAPAYDINDKDVDLIVNLAQRVIIDFFDEFDARA